MSYNGVKEQPDSTGVDIATKTVAGVEAQVVVDAGAESHAHGGTAVTASAASILAANTTRRRVTFYSRGDGGEIYLGASGVAVGQGAMLPALAGASVVIESRAQIFAIATVNPSNITWLEEFD